jgi:hypothetical protein
MWKVTIEQVPNDTPLDKEFEDEDVEALKDKIKKLERLLNRDQDLVGSGYQG